MKPGSLRRPFLLPGLRLFLLAGLASGCEQRDVPAFAYAEAIDSLGAAALAEGPIAGLSIAVAEGGRLVFDRGYGVQALELGTPATQHTVYNVASTAKILAAAGVVRLVESGRLSLEDSLAALLPVLGVEGAASGITLRQLLNMTSGLNDYVEADIERLQTSPAPLTPRFVLDHVRGRPLDFAPGSQWTYTNTGFYLAGLVVEQVTGKPWGDYIIDDVARPLGLEDTWVCDVVPDGRATGYEHSTGGFTLSALDAEQGVRGDAGLCSTAGDLARLPAALAGGRLISTAGLEVMLAPTRLTSGLTVDYGLGISRGVMGGRRLWGHLGGSGSIVSTLAHYPDDDLTIAVLVNTRDGAVGALDLEGRVAELVLGLTPELQDQNVDEALGLELEGLYAGDRGPTTFEMVREGHRLVRSSPGNAESRTELLWQGGRTFGRSDWPYDRFVFKPSGGRAEAFSAYYNGFFDGYYRRLQ